ncbi:YjbF family lipoprotein [Halomonas almeriensis]|uniref:YjbF family lipoprotein n=1 Tax=Halomonas almeriensis TaxID=308163 RepID=UPI0025B4FCA6|nr:YjbF family lipoprotein [Halomonas almeriensis]MDN3552584.1 YjbF family lipoprotein [Halomonas almeriensis]
MGAILFDEDASAEAKAVPYASLDARVGDIQGLFVMGAKAGRMTYWPAQGGMLLELDGGGLQAFQGRDSRLLSSRYRPEAPWQASSSSPVSLTRYVESSDGQVVRHLAEGTTRCSAEEPVALPLGERRLEVCRLELQWSRGETTTATYWRDPDTRRLWAVKQVAWPEGPEVSWRVARHWW